MDSVTASTAAHTSPSWVTPAKERDLSHSAWDPPGLLDNSRMDFQVAAASFGKGGFRVAGVLYWGVMSSLLLIIINSLKIRLLMISTQKSGAGLSQEQHNYLLMRCKFPKEMTAMYRNHLLN